MPGASQVGAWCTKHGLFTTNYEPRSPSCRDGEQSDEKLVIVRGALKPLLGVVIVENIGGGGSSLGAAQVAHARPDGYAILLGGTLPHVNEALLKSRPLYDPVNDLDPIANVAVNSLGIAVHPSVPAKTLQELVAYAKANPGKLVLWLTPASGSLTHLAGELFKSLTGTPEIVQVPYQAAPVPAIADLISRTDTDGRGGRDWAGDRTASALARCGFWP